MIRRVKTGRGLPASLFLMRARREAPLIRGLSFLRQIVGVGRGDGRSGHRRPPFPVSTDTRITGYHSSPSRKPTLDVCLETAVLG